MSDTPYHPTIRSQAFAAVDLLRRVIREQCVCGHAKSQPGESHFFGDPPRGVPMHTRCMHGDCDCPAYTPDHRAEWQLHDEIRAFLKDVSL